MKHFVCFKNYANAKSSGRKIQVTDKHISERDESSSSIPRGSGISKSADSHWSSSEALDTVKNEDRTKHS